MVTKSRKDFNVINSLNMNPINTVFFLTLATSLKNIKDFKTISVKTLAKKNQSIYIIIVSI
jgi:hypothetical protein